MESRSKIELNLGNLLQIKSRLSGTRPSAVECNGIFFFFFSFFFFLSNVLWIWLEALNLLLFSTIQWEEAGTLTTVLQERGKSDIALLLIWL